MARIKARQERAAFSFYQRMVLELRRNARKGGWEDDTIKDLSRRMYEEAAELMEAIEKGRAEDIVKEAADVANFAMMIADVAAGCPDGGEMKIPHGGKPSIARR